MPKRTTKTHSLGYEDQDSSWMRALFAPKSVALIGATPDLTRAPAGRLLAYLDNFGYRGRVLPVNPKYDRIASRKCYASVEELPSAPDLALICLRAELVPQELARVLKCGVGAAMIFAGGFSETGLAGRRLQTRIEHVAADYPNVPILGPNCQGIANFRSHFVANFSGSIGVATSEAGPVAVLSQSGAIAGRIFRTAFLQGLRFSYVVSTGNEVCVDLSDCIEYVSRDETVKVIACYLEGSSRGSKLRSCLLRARERGKEVIVLKPGISEGSRRAIHSHTNALVGSDDVFDAVFEAAGALRARSIAETITIMSALAGRELTLPRRHRARVLILSPSGGGGALLADACSQEGLEIPGLPKHAQQRFREILPEYASTNNPIDFSDAWVADPEILVRLASLAADDQAIDAILLFLGQGTSKSPALHSKAKASVILANRASKGKAFVVGWPVDLGDDVRELRSAGVTVFASEAECALALRAVTQPVVIKPLLAAAAPRQVGVQWSDWFTAHSGNPVLSLHDSMELLESQGLTAAPGKLVRSFAEGREFAREVGFPVLLKAEFADLVHRTDLNGVSGTIQSAQHLRRSYAQFIRTFGNHRGFLGLSVHKVIRGIEVFVGLKVDPVFGPVIVVANGGKLVELLDDKCIFLPPVARSEVAQTIRRTPLGQLLSGYRGGSRAKIGALCDVVTRLGDLALQIHPYVENVDLNPVMVNERTAVVVDAKVSIRRGNT